MSIIRNYKVVIGIAITAFVAMAATAVYLLVKYDLFHQITALINETTPAAIFIPMMLFLPLAGVPISFFLLLLGIKFGLVKGLLLLQTALPIHMLIAYFLAFAIRKPLENFLVRRKNYRIPEVPAHKEFIFSFLFLTFPVFPYSVKIYMLPLAGVKFRYCFWLNWAIQGTLCIPLVLLGRSAADLNVVMFGVTLLLFVVMYVFLHWIKKQYAAFQNGKIS